MQGVAAISERVTMSSAAAVVVAQALGTTVVLISAWTPTTSVAVHDLSGPKMKEDQVSFRNWTLTCKSGNDLERLHSDSR